MTSTPPPASADHPDASPMGYVEPGIVRISARTALVLLIFTLVFTGLMAGTYKLTAPMLAASAQGEKLRLINEVLPPSSYDNDLLADSLTLAPQSLLNFRSDGMLYRARKGGTPVALVFETLARDGYSGNITMVMAVSADGRLLALRVTQHKETPGLGDYIDPKKDRNKRSPWINQFVNAGFDTVPREKWRVKKDGGQFDQVSGATISARAVTNASRRALDWVLPRRDALFSMTSGQRYDEAAQGGTPQ